MSKLCRNDSYKTKYDDYIVFSWRHNFFFITLSRDVSHHINISLQHCFEFPKYSQIIVQRPPPNSDHLSTTATVLRSQLDLLKHKWPPSNGHLSTTVTIFGSRGWSFYTGLTVRYSQTFVQRPHLGIKISGRCWDVALALCYKNWNWDSKMVVLAQVWL